jgi:RND family efflux transporter MFP subunit
MTRPQATLLGALRMRTCAAAAGAALLAAAGCGREAASQPPAGRGDAARVVTLSVGPLEDVFVLSGEIEAVRSLDFAAPRSGSETRIQWLAEDGAEVRAGDMLIAYDASQILATLEDKRLRAMQAAIDLESRRRSTAADVEGRRAVLERASVEWEKARLRAAVPAELQPRRDWQDTQNALRRAAAALDKARLDARAGEVAARAEVESARAALDKARRDLDETERTLRALRVRAPRDGIFLVRDHWNRSEARRLQAGDSVFMGYAVASLPDLSELQVGARLWEVDEGRVAVGQEARCTLDTYPERVYAGRVAEISSVADAGPRASGFRVRVALTAPDPARMRPGMSVRVEVVRRRFERVLSVPRGALEREAGRVFARRPGGSRAELRLGPCTPGACVVESGLKEGERVALR